jgi:hypothetical protein
VSYSNTIRAHSIVLFLALLAVAATLAIVVSRVSVYAVTPGSCYGLSPAAQLAGNGACASDGSHSNPVAYRMP